jgi:hypothetical protein
MSTLYNIFCARPFFPNITKCAQNAKKRILPQTQTLSHVHKSGQKAYKGEESAQIHISHTREEHVYMVFPAHIHTCIPTCIQLVKKLKKAKKLPKYTLFTRGNMMWALNIVMTKSIRCPPSPPLTIEGYTNHPSGTRAHLNHA